MKCRKHLFIADLHVGSKFALWPQRFSIPDFGEIPLGINQKILWLYWSDLIKTVKKVGRLDSLVLVGDLIDGKGSKAEGVEQIVTDPLTQARAAVELLKPLREHADKLFLVRGTKYHDQINGRAVEYIGEILGAEKFEDGTYSAWELVLDLGDDHYAHVSHHGGNPYVYRATVAEREGFFMSLSADKFDLPEGRSWSLIVRAHTHFFIHIEHPTLHIVYLPAWKLKDPYMIRKGPGRMIPHIGAVLVLVRSESGREIYERDPLKICKLTYKHPRPSRRTAYKAYSQGSGNEGESAENQP